MACLHSRLADNQAKGMLAVLDFIVHLLGLRKQVESSKIAAGRPLEVGAKTPTLKLAS